MSEPLEILTEDEVHVWLLAYEPGASESTALVEAEALPLLDPAEATRHARFQAPDARRQHLLGQGLLRTTLSRYAPVAPGAWRIQRSPQGRPHLAPGQTHLPLDFNLSHASGLVALAVARDRRVGLDVEEWTRDPGDLLALAEEFFAPQEAAATREAPPEDLAATFYRFWTLKEAFLKAEGRGLRVPLASFAFRLAPAPSLETAPGDPARWRFHLHRPTPRHQLALAVEARPGETPRVQLRDVTPGAAVRPCRMPEPTV